MEIHLAAVHHINPCLDESGQRRKVGAMQTSSTSSSSNAYLPDLGLNAEEQAFLKALSESRNDVQASEDELLAQVMALSAQEVGVKPINTGGYDEMKDLPRSPPPISPQDSFSDLHGAELHGADDWDADPAEHHDEFGGVKDDDVMEVVEEIECIFCGSSFPSDEIEAHVHKNHRDEVY
jgi:hypothetical protein